MKKILVTKNFDINHTIGYLHILEKELPKGADYIFSIGGKVIEKEGNVIKKFELTQVSLIPEYSYKNYLKIKKQK